MFGVVEELVGLLEHRLVRRVGNDRRVHVSRERLSASCKGIPVLECLKLLHHFEPCVNDMNLIVAVGRVDLNLESTKITSPN